MEKVFAKMAETAEVMPIFYKSAFLSCVEDKRRSKILAHNWKNEKLLGNKPQTIKTVRDHAHLLADFLHNIISMMFDSKVEKNPLALEQIARTHLRLEPLGFQRTLWIQFGESLAEVMFSEECVRAYPHAPSAWSLLSITISDHLHALAKRSRSLQIMPISRTLPITFDQKPKMVNQQKLVPSSSSLDAVSSQADKSFSRQCRDQISLDPNVIDYFRTDSSQSDSYIPDQKLPSLLETITSVQPQLSQVFFPSKFSISTPIFPNSTDSSVATTRHELASSLDSVVNSSLIKNCVRITRV
ncbi:unnamed protein product [Thelazia callipaeda]|uniref:GLOBIN domain-containing protein n=1 Tax=Thelazia callipaeda TaxID=103827 RepID=A0A158RAW8_THECL|nr:unnamed protein product [Thelazia callipaeda]